MSSTDNSLALVFSTNDLQLLNNSDFLNELAVEINQLILTNFERLVQLLYRIDVSEMKLKNLLKENPNEDAGKLIATLIVERQIQKLRYRSEHSSTNEEDTKEEKW